MYPGGKNGSGVYQAIINLMPPHDTYIEAFLGSGAVMRHKRPAQRNIGIDLDAVAITGWNADSTRSDIEIIHGDALAELASARLPLSSKTLLYADPPYPLSVRRGQRPIYRCEILKDEEHERLLTLLKSLDCMVMVSSYESGLYNALLKDWRRSEFYTTTRGSHRVKECVWMNFPEPLELHDYRFLGDNYRTRQDFKRMRERWRSKLLNMDSQRRFALMAEIENLRDISQAK